MLVILAVVVAGFYVFRDNRETIYVFNWGDYIDESVISRFEKETGIKVVYDVFSTNEDMYVKIQAGGSSYDVAFPSDYMIKRMIDEDMLEKINFDNVPNYKYVDERFKDLDFDPNNEYSVPYFWGTVGILYNTAMVDEEVDSWDILWDKKYEKQILMLDSQRDSIGVALLKLGYSLNTKDIAQLEEAGELLKQQKPLVLAYVVDEVKDKMVAGEAALAVVWSGDAVQGMAENENLAYAIPKSGTNMWVDSMVIPKGAKNKEGAEKFINFMLSTEIAYLNTKHVMYSTPQTEAKKMLDEWILNNPAAYPSDEALENTETFQALGDVLREYDRIWTEVKAR